MPDNLSELGDADLGQPDLASSAPITLAPQAAPPPAAPDREFTVKARTQRQIIMRRFLQHKLAVASLIVFVLVVLFAFVGGALWHFKYGVPDSDYTQFDKGPSLRHPFGTDGQAYDEMALVMRGSQRSIEIAMCTALLATVIGTLVGAVAGYYRGWVDTVLMRLVDLVLTIPVLVLGIMLADKFPQASSWWGLTLVLSSILWAGTSRVIRGQVLSLREKEFVEAARALGASDRRIILRHILPNVAGTLIVVVTLGIAGTILTETALSFLNFGVKPQDTSLGILVNDGKTAIEGGWPWLFDVPRNFNLLIALTANFIGDGQRDAFDPTETRVRA